jgi:hypothetical protein
MANLKFGGDMQRIKVVFFGILFWILTVSTGWAIIITEPKAGTVFHPGDKVVVKVELTPEEAPGGVSKGVFIRAHKMADDSTLAFKAPFELEFTIEKHFIGEDTISASAKLLNGDIAEAEIPITVILPSTTKVVSIDAAFTGGKKTFLEIARKLNGELVVTEGTRSTDQLSVSAVYSDGVERGIASKPETKYSSANEKVAIVIPGVGTRPLVKATGPGKTSIIVQYGELTDRVTVNVKECPYTEGMKRCSR